MDAERLIEQITELVYSQLTGGAPPNGQVTDPRARVADLALAVLSSTTPVAEAPAPSRGQLLVVMGEGRRGMETLSGQIKPHAKSHRVVAVPSETWPAARVKPALGLDEVHIVDRPPRDWTELAKGSRAVLVPNLTVNSAAGIALLAGLEPCSAAVVAALIEGTPVVAGCDELSFLSMNAAHLSKPFLEVMRTHVSRVQSLGVQLVEMKKLGEELARLTDPKAAPSAGRGRNVLTAEDVDTMLRSGLKVIEVAANTIVTPLAREVARSAGVEIVGR